MIYLLYGDRVARAKKAEALGDSFLRSNLVAPLVELEGELTAERLEELSSSQGLFHPTSAYLMRNMLETMELRELFIKHVKLLGASRNIFIVSEPSATKELIKAVEKAGGEAMNAGEEPKPARRESSNFAVADALARRDRKLAWALFYEAAASGAVPEELHGIIFWQMKNLWLAKRGGNGGPFSYPLMRAKSYAPKWEERELSRALSRLVFVYHESHRGRFELGHVLESFLLETV